MKTIARILILAGLGASLTGCIVVPGPPPRAYVAAPVVVVHPAYWGPRFYYYGPRW